MFDKKYANLHLLPLFQKKIAYGSNHFPWVIGNQKSKILYNKGICPVAEQLNSKTYLGYELCQFEMDKREVNLFIKAFKKVWANLEYLKKIDKK